MIDYQKLCLLAFKVLGIVLSAYGIVTFLVSIIFYFGGFLLNPNVKISGMEFSMFVQIVTGVILFSLSEKLTSIVFEYPKKNDKE